MSALSGYLRDNLIAETKAEKDAWLQMSKALGNGDHLEAVLEGKTLPAHRPPPSM